MMYIETYKADSASTDYVVPRHFFFHAGSWKSRRERSSSLSLHSVGALPFWEAFPQAFTLVPKSSEVLGFAFLLGVPDSGGLPYVYFIFI